MPPLRSVLPWLACIAFVGGAEIVGACGSSGDDPGTGGQQAASTTGDGGSGGTLVMFPCGFDCATLATDACHIAQCDMTKLQCELVDAKDGVSCEDGKFCTEV